MRALAGAETLEGFCVLFGGSFNPPHMGHQMACLYLLEALGAQNVVLMPCGSHAFGKALMPFERRFAMCQAMAAPLGSRVETSRLEGDTPGLSRTLNTLRALQEDRPAARRWAFVVGADLVAELPRWHGFEELVAAATPVVLGRGGFGIDPEAMASTLGHGAIVAPLDLPEVSSTQLRAQLAQQQSLRGWVPNGVLDLLKTSP